MALKNQPPEGQTFILAPGVAGNLVSAEARPTPLETAFVDLTERAAYLVAVLKTYDQLPDQASWLRMAKMPDSSLHNSIYSGSIKKGDDIIKGRQKEHDDAVAVARTLFGRAYGEHAVIDAGLLDEEEVKQHADEEYSNFERAYRGGSDVRKAKRELLRNQLARTAFQPVQDPAHEKSVDQPRPVRPKAKVNLGTMLRPDFQGLKIDRYSDVSFEDMQYYSPQFLRKHLLDVPVGSPNSERYVCDDSGRMRFIALSPSAWKLARSVSKLAESARINLEENRSQSSFVSLDQDAPRRAGVHAVESRRVAIENYRTNVLNGSLQLVCQFEEALSYSGNLSRFGNEANARAKLAELQSGVIQQMLLTVAMHANMAHENRRKMALSVEKAIYLAPTDAQRKRNFKELIGLAKAWLHAEDELLSGLSAEADYYISQNQIDE